MRRFVKAALQARAGAAACAALCLLAAGCRARGCVCDTFLLGFGQGFLRHQQTLPLVSFAFSVESHHHCRE